MLRRQVLIGGSLVLGTSVTAACGGGGQPAGSENEAAPGRRVGSVDATLTWQEELPQSVMQQIDSFLAGWNQKYPKVKIETIDMGGGDADKVEKILALAAGGTPVDVVGKVTFIQPIARPGAVRPLEPLLKRDKYDISGYNQGWLKTFGTLDGKLYSLPWGLGGNSVAFIYSPAAFAEVGLKPPSQDWKAPWKWDDYRETAKRLTKKQGDTYARVGADDLGDRTYTIPMQFGGQWMAEDGKTVTCASPQMIDAYTRYLEMALKDRTTVASPGVNLSGGNDGRFGNGLSAMSYMGGWQMTTWTDPTKYKVDYAVATYPKATYSSPDADTIQVAVGNNSKFPEESWAFAKWLLEDGKYANLVFRMPTLAKDASAWAKDAFKNVPASARIDLIVDSLKLARPQDPVRAHIKVATIEKEVSGPLMKDLLAEQTNVKDGLAEAKRKIEGIIATS